MNPLKPITVDEYFEGAETLQPMELVHGIVREPPRGSRRFRTRHVQASARVTLPSLSASQMRPALRGIGV